MHLPLAFHHDRAGEDHALQFDALLLSGRPLDRLSGHLELRHAGQYLAALHLVVLQEELFSAEAAAVALLVQV